MKPWRALQIKRIGLAWGSGSSCLKGISQATPIHPQSREYPLRLTRRVVARAGAVVMELWEPSRH